MAEISSVVSRNPDRLSVLNVEVDEEDLPAVIARLCMRKFELSVLSSFEKEFTIFGAVPAEVKLTFVQN